MIRKSRHSSDGTESSRFDERSAEGYAEYVFERVPKPQARCVGYDGSARYSYAPPRSVSSIGESLGRSKVVTREMRPSVCPRGFLFFENNFKEVL